MLCDKDECVAEAEGGYGDDGQGVYVQCTLCASVKDMMVAADTLEDAITQAAAAIYDFRKQFEKLREGLGNTA